LLFIYAWEQRTLNDVLKVNSGKDYKHLNHGDIPVYGTGGYMLSVDESLSNEDAVGLGRKGTIDKPQLLHAPFWTVDTLFYLTPKSNNELRFLFALAQGIEWAKLDESTGVPSLSKANIENVVKYVPDYHEQTHIGQFFRTLDNTIAIHKRKLDSLRELKKAYLQVLFPQAGETVPKVRFVGFTEPWSIKKLSEYMETSKTKNRQNLFSKQEVLSVSGEVGIINQIEFQGRSFAGVSVAEYGVVNTGDVVYTKSPLKSNPHGIIKANTGVAGIVSTLYAVYKPLLNANPLFVQYYFEHDTRLNSYLKPLVNKGAKNDMKVSDDNALMGDVIFPNRDEQDAIVVFMKTLDKQIISRVQKLEQIGRLKSAYLQKIFV